MKKTILIVSILISAICGLACTARPTGPVDKTWLSPGKVNISNLKPGSIARQEITIHNGNKIEAEFSVYYRIPDYVEAGFVPAPVEALDWIMIGEKSFSLEAGQTIKVEVELKLPDDTQFPEHWELWIGCKENIKSSLTTELCSRWLITMAKK
jgi:hypothetical protein